MLKKKLLGPRLYIPNAGGPGSIPGSILDPTGCN